MTDIVEAGDLDRVLSHIEIHYAEQRYQEGYQFLYSSPATLSPTTRIVFLGLNPLPIMGEDGHYLRIGSHCCTGGRHPFASFFDRPVTGEATYAAFGRAVCWVVNELAELLSEPRDALLEEILISNFLPFASKRFPPRPADSLATAGGAVGQAASLGPYAFGTRLWRSLLQSDATQPAILKPTVLIAAGRYLNSYVPSALGSWGVPPRGTARLKGHNGHTIHFFHFVHPSQLQWYAEVRKALPDIARALRHP